jgi:hypothetical protein
VGVVFADPATVKYRIDTHSPYNDEFSIPPGAADYKVELKYAFTREGLLWSFYPHMHLRGRSFRYTALYPDGGREVLLDVPRFDFNWQNIYELAEPKKLPAGTVIHCEAHFDNSENNLANPDPSKTIVWGGQIWDEMMTGHMDVAVVAAETLE